jgi:hypothetical protein
MIESTTPPAPSDLRIDTLDAALIPDGAALLLAIRSLSVRLSHDGLQRIVSSLIPEEPLAVRIVNESSAGRCSVELKATRMGFNARIVLRLRVANDLPGGILINVDPYGRWSPVDRIMLGIAQHNLDKLAREQPGFTQVATSRYQVDLQSVIRNKLLDSRAPVRWDARLQRINGSDDAIRVDFVSMVTNEE